MMAMVVVGGTWLLFSMVSSFFSILAWLPYFSGSSPASRMLTECNTDGRMGDCFTTTELELGSENQYVFIAGASGNRESRNTMIGDEEMRGKDIFENIRKKSWQRKRRLMMHLPMKQMIKKRWKK
jgi:hypothetical protein